MVKFRRIA